MSIHGYDCIKKVVDPLPLSPPRKSRRSGRPPISTATAAVDRLGATVKGWSLVVVVASYECPLLFPSGGHKDGGPCMPTGGRGGKCDWDWRLSILVAWGSGCRPKCRRVGRGMETVQSGRCPSVLSVASASHLWAATSSTQSSGSLLNLFKSVNLMDLFQDRRPRRH